MMQGMKLRGNVVVVTGAGGGMGRQLALQLLEERGARVALVDIDGAGLDETAKLAGSRAADTSKHVVDISDRDAVQALPAAVIEAHGRVDAVINNAGIIQPFDPVLELDESRIAKVFDVNFFGTLYMCRAFLPHLLERPEAHLANVSSMGGFMPFPGQTIYGASKAAVKLLTEGLASELADTRVHVTIIFPGAVATEIAAHSGVTGLSLEDAKDAPIKPLAPEAAARTMLDGIERDQSRILVGKDARLMDVMSRVAPGRAAQFIARQMKKMPKSRG